MRKQIVAVASISAMALLTGCSGWGGDSGYGTTTGVAATSGSSTTTQANPQGYYYGGDTNAPVGSPNNRPTSNREPGVSGSTGATNYGQGQSQSGNSNGCTPGAGAGCLGTSPNSPGGSVSQTRKSVVQPGTSGSSGAADSGSGSSSTYPMTGQQQNSYESISPNRPGGDMSQTRKSLPDTAGTQ